MRLEGLGKLKQKKFNELIENRSRDLPASSIVPQPLCYHVPLDIIQYILNAGAEFVRKFCTTLIQLDAYCWESAAATFHFGVAP
jgi:hypothetical protein